MKQLFEKAGHGSEIRPSESRHWSRAGSGGSYTNWGFLAGIQVEADEMEAMILELAEKDPPGFSKSQIGKMILYPYWNMGLVEGSEKIYPYQFTEPDLAVDGLWITAQLVAEEYFEGADEACPLTTEFFESWNLETGRRWGHEKFKDPFSTDERPDVTIEMNQQDKIETMNLNPTCQVTPKPKDGFIAIERS